MKPETDLRRDARFAFFCRLFQFGYLVHFVREYVTLRPSAITDLLASNPLLGSVCLLSVLGSLVCSLRVVIGGATPRWILISTACLVVEGLTAPFAIPNHFALMLAASLFQSSMLSALAFAESEVARAAYLRQTTRGLAALLIGAYAAAGFHKLNYAWFDLAQSPGASTLREMARVLGMGAPSPFVLVSACFLVILFECALPFATYLSRRIRPFGILLLLALHFPMNSTLGAMDYPWIATSFYPLLFPEAEWRSLEAGLKRRRGAGILGAGLGALITFLLIPPSARLLAQTPFAVAVGALWGFAVPVILAECRRALRVAIVPSPTSL